MIKIFIHRIPCPLFCLSTLPNMDRHLSQAHPHLEQPDRKLVVAIARKRNKNILEEEEEDDSCEEDEEI